MDYITQAITANTAAIVLLALLLFNFAPRLKTEKADMKVFFLMILVNLFQCVVEPITLILDGKMFFGAVTINRAMNSLLYVGNISFAAMWVTYVDLRLERVSQKLSPRYMLKYVPAMLVVLGSLVNMFTPVFFEISADNWYHRTKNYVFAYVITYGYLMYSMVVAYCYGKNSQRYYFLPVLTFLSPVFVASTLQLLFYGISALWVGTAIGLTTAYVALLKEGVDVDTLSGVYNRHYMNIQLASITSQSRENKMVAGIMLDIDNFKVINDRWGHMEGDEAIRAVGKLLLATVNPKGTVYRFAGDEFTILLQVSSDREIQQMRGRIHQAVRRYNEAGGKPYQLSFSIGHAIFAPGEPLADFVSRMDEAMYNDKKQKMLRLAGNAPDLGSEYQVNPNRNRILLVDDDFINREILKNIFPGQYRIEEAANGKEALEKIRLYADSLCAILTDLEMPEMDGRELLRQLHGSHLTEKIPTFLITANDEYGIAKQAYELGVVDVISKPVVPFVILRRVQSVLELFHARESLRATVQGQERQLKENAFTIDTLHRNTIEALASAIEFRDIESGEHINRIYGITKYLLSHTEMGQGFSDEEIENMATGSIMHDVGKIAISDVILNKPGKLTAEEYEIMKQHTVKGSELLEQIARNQSHPSYVYALDIARHHHERWDGNGYPDGLKGDEISPWAQAASIADVYDALVSPRVYKKAFDPDTAVEMIRSGQCGVFGPKLLECFLSVEPEIRKRYQEDARTDSTDETSAELNTPQEVTNVMLLFDAVRNVYDMVFAANLSQNRFAMIDSEKFQSNRLCYGEVFDRMAEHACEAVVPSHKEIFANTLYREPLLEAFSKGTKKLHLEYPEVTDQGRLRQVETTVIMMEDTRTGDILDVTLTRYIDQ